VPTSALLRNCSHILQPERRRRCRRGTLAQGAKATRFVNLRVTRSIVTVMWVGMTAENPCRAALACSSE
jgi:hypothetical protein